MTDQPFYLANNTGLIQARPEDDLLHREVNAGIEGDTLTETQYFGFNVPEKNIHGLTYLWHHPNLNVVTGGLMVFQGVKPISMAAELFDFRIYMNDTVLDNDIHDYRLDNGFGVKILEPNKRFHLTYEDAARGNAIDLVSEAVTPVALFGDGKHFEQGMKVRGTLKLRGEEHQVDCFNVRDRSWGKLRPEALMPMPPVSWMTGSFGEDFIFNCNLMDHVGSNPQITAPFEIPQDKALNGGWVWRNGKLSLITAARKEIRRDDRTFQPQEVTLHLTVEDGSTFVARGTLAASCPYATWTNMHANISLIRWDVEGRIGYGDMQDVIWNDFAYSVASKALVPA
ncbi:hypothetical protein [Novosphingobium sp. 9U]|uniref:DUF7064 domain-containing protein n=1 Tax=Novosphingobium sp. 9U TaxID=2653158 RepID=UPI0012F053E4|nr:hypothetical protein [Novosphingobium sp. 9U]VWX50205.1 conserved hypothetical protein [Novosphingobium sp. 9U]